MSHITTLKTRLNDIEALKAFVKFKLEPLGAKWCENTKVRFWNLTLSKKKYDYCIKMPGQYDIGINCKDDSITLDADWSFGDFYNKLNLPKKSQKSVENFFTEGQNEMKFRKWAQRKRYKVKEIIDQKSGKKQLIAEQWR